MADDQNDPYAAIATPVSSSSADPYAAIATPVSARAAAPPPSPNPTVAPPPAPAGLPAGQSLPGLPAHAAAPDMSSDASFVPLSPSIARGQNEDLATRFHQANQDAIAPVKELGSGISNVAQGLNAQSHPEYDTTQAANGQANAPAVSAPPLSAQDQDAAKKQTLVGLTQIIAGGGTVAMAIGAPEVAGIAQSAFAGNLAAKVALAKFAGSLVIGTGASGAAGYAADKFNLSPEAKNLVQTAAFFVPSLFGLAGVHETYAEGGGNAAYSARVGKFGVDVGQSPEAYGVRAGVRGVGSVEGTIPRSQPAPGSGLSASEGVAPPPPTAVDITAHDLLFANVETMQQSAQADAAAAAIVKGATPEEAVAAQVPKPPPTPQQQMQQAASTALFPPGSPRAITQNMMTTTAQVIRALPPEAQPQAILEAHANLTQLLTGWVGHTVVGPDMKPFTIDSPKAAAAMATKLTGAAVDAHDAATAAAQKQATAAAAPPPAPKLPTAGQSKLQAAKQNAQQARVATIMESQIPPGYEDNPNVIRSVVAMRLGISDAEAQPLIDKYNASKIPTVGSAQEPVVEERPETIDAQMAALKAGTINVVHIPAGGKYMPPQPAGIQKVTTPSSDPGAGTYFFKPGRGLRAQTIKTASAAGTHGDLTGHIQTKEELASAPSTVAVVAQDAKTGTEIQASEVDPSKPQVVAQQAKILADRHPGAEIVVKHTDELIGDRLKPTRAAITTKTGERIAGDDGKKTTVKTPMGQHEGVYRLVESKDVIPSHNALNFEPVAKYPADVQERDYKTDKAAQFRVTDHAQNYDPAYTVSDDPTGTNGPPVITPDGIALGGNSRAMSTQRAYEMHPKQAQGYRDALKEKASHFGFTPEQVDKMDRPMLVREIAKPATIDEMARVGSALNKNETGVLTPEGKAVSAGRKITPETMDELGRLIDATGDNASIRDMMREHGAEALDLLERTGALTGHEAKGFRDGTGVSGDGKNFIEDAILGNIVDDANLMKATPKAILNKLDSVLAAVTNLSARNDAYDIIAPLRDALHQHAEVSERGITLSDFQDQGGIFGAPREVNPVVDAIARKLAEKPTAVKKAFRDFAADAKDARLGQGGMFGAADEPFEKFNQWFGTKLTDEEYTDGIAKGVYEDAPPAKEGRAGEGDSGVQASGAGKPEAGSKGDLDRAGSGSTEPAEVKPAAKYAPTKGDRVRYKAKDGTEKAGIVKHETPLGIRIAPDGGGKPDFISKKNVRGPVEEDKPATAETTVPTSDVVKINKTTEDDGVTSHVFSILDADGKHVGAGSVEETPKFIKLWNIAVDAPGAKGKGYGIKAYQYWIDKALAAGKEFRSDSEVSADAIRVYEALVRRGYAVERNPKAKPEAGGKLFVPGSIVGRDTPAVFSVNSKKNVRGPVEKDKPAVASTPKTDEPVTFVRKSLQTGKEDTLTLPGRTVPIEDDRENRHPARYGPYHIEPDEQGGSRLIDAKGTAWAVGADARMQELADKYNAEETPKLAPTPKPATPQIPAMNGMTPLGGKQVAEIPKKAEDVSHGATGDNSGSGDRSTAVGEQSGEVGTPKQGGDAKGMGERASSPGAERDGELGTRGERSPAAGSGKRVPESADAGTGEGTGAGGESSDADAGTGLAEPKDEDGDRDVAEGDAQASPVAAKKAVQKAHNSNNYRIDPATLADQTTMAAGGIVGRIQGNIRAIKIVKELEKENRPATKDEKKQLSEYVGWGMLPQVFDNYRPETQKYYDELKALLTPEEYRAARTSVLNAHFTAPDIIQGMWSLAQRLGVTGGNILEPSMGTGLFYGLIPKAISQKSSLTGVELDNITGAIAKYLYPDAQIAVKGYEEITLPDNSIDFATGNVPFANIQIRDPRYKPSLSIHNYFFAKTLDKLKPGGIMSMITSAFTLDAPSNSPFREMLSNQADLVGAIRLPSSAFKKNAGTEVVADILVFRKRYPGEVANRNFINTTETAPGMVVNEYIAAHPENVLGEQTLEGSMYRDKTYTVTLPREKLAERLDRAIATFPKKIWDPGQDAMNGERLAALNERTLSPDNLKNGSYTVHKDKVMQSKDGVLVPVAKDKVVHSERIRSAIAVRTAAKEIIRSQIQTSDESILLPARKTLNTTYDAFVKRFGPLNSRDNAKILGDDPEYPLLAALEDFTKAVKARPAKGDALAVESSPEYVGKSAIFTKSTSKPYEPLDPSTFPKDLKAGLARVLGASGTVDIPLMAELSGKKPSEISSELLDAKLIFQDPQSGEYVTKDDYLSGNVREKLKQAQEAASLNGAFAGNVKELEKVQPPDLTIHDIANTKGGEDAGGIKPGSPWIPTEAYEDFMRHLTGDEGKRSNQSLKITRSVGEQRNWSLAMNGYRDADLRGKWAGGGVSGDTLFMQSMNQVMPTVRYKDSDGKYRVDSDATMAAREMQQKIKEEFSNWLTKHEKWGNAAAANYNRDVNNRVLREFDGSHLTFPGMATEMGGKPFALMPHQVNFIWRGIQEGRGLAAHVVGAGKTFEAIALGMELRRMGLSSKNLYAVPNNKLADWKNDFARQYPGSNVLAVGLDDFDATNRQTVMGRMATGDYDAIVMPHSHFDMMSVSPALETKAINDDLDEAREALETAKANGDKISRKEIEKSILQLKQRLVSLTALRSDKSTYFDDLGVTTLFVDEAHAYKNLYFYTHMHMPGLPNSKALKSTRMKMKTDYINTQNKGRGVVFLTGTPITNTIAELYNMTRYVAPDLLHAQGIKTFDDWVAIYGSPKTEVEYAPDGVTMRAVTRMARYSNMPELSTMFHTFADVKTLQDLPFLKVPKVNRHEVHVKINHAQEEMLEHIARRAKDLSDGRPQPLQRGDGKVQDDNWLWLSSDARKISLDARLHDSKAEDTASSKSNSVSDSVDKIYKQTKAEKGIQLIFSDLSKNHTATPGKVGPAFDIFKDIRAKLIARGVPASEIAIVDGEMSARDLSTVQDRARAGTVRVLLGSTAKMGVGLNIQKRLKAIHHIDQPWRPSDVEQRDGRGVRQGNDYSEIDINRYISVPEEGTVKRRNAQTGDWEDQPRAVAYDVQLFQKLEQKQGFINQLMTNNMASRSIEDPGGEVLLDYASMKADATGNPDVFKKVGVTHDLTRAMSSERSFWANRTNIQYRLGHATSEIAFYKNRAQINGKLEEAYKKSEKDGFSAVIDGKKFTERQEASKYLEDRNPFQAGDSLELYGQDVTFGSRPTLSNHIRKLTYSIAGSESDAPDTRSGIIASVEHALRSGQRNKETNLASIEKENENVASYREQLKESSPYEAKIKELRDELAGLNVRLGLNPDGSVLKAPQIVPDAGDDVDGDENDSEAGFMNADLIPGVATAGKFLEKDVMPLIDKIGGSTKEAAAAITNLLMPTAGANLDVLDSLMRLKGDQERQRFAIENIFKGVSKMFDKMPEQGRIDFLDRYKTGRDQETADLNKIADLYRKVDDATYRRIVDAQIGNMDRATRNAWDKLDASARNEYFGKVMDGRPIAMPSDVARATDMTLDPTTRSDAKLRLRLQRIADNTLTFKADHFRSFWKVIPGSGKERTPDRTKRGPLRGDRGMLKRSTLPDVSTGIEAGGVLATDNPQKLFEMAQSSSLRYITAQNWQKEMGDLGMRKFVRDGERAPDGWATIPDSIADVYFPVDALTTPKEALPDLIAKDELNTRRSIIHSGKWYYEPSAARLMSNYLSKNWFQTNAVGRGLMAVKNLTTAIELSLSPFHLVFESMEAIGSQFGLGAMHVMNLGIGQGKLSGLMQGGKAMLTSPLAPFTLSRTGGSAIKAAANMKEFLAGPRGAAFLKAFPDAPHLIDLAFTGGLVMGMPADYRVNLMESARAAMSDGNYFGAMIRAVPGVIQTVMNPLFEKYIPRLKMGFFLEAMSQQMAEHHDALMSGEMSEAELARKVVNSVENRFGELNFSNLWLNNTFKGAAQLEFRSVTWKLGNWRGATAGIAGQSKEFAAPLKTMYDDWKGNRKGSDRKAGDYIPKLDLNMSWLVAIGVTTAVIGTILSKLRGGKYPWEYLDEDERSGMSAPGALALEMAHPRTGHTDSYTGAPERISLPTGLRDFEHAYSDPRGYLHGSESGFIGKTLDTWDNRDFFGNYVYDPNGTAYQKLASILSYNAPVPIIAQGVMQGKKTGDFTRAKLGAFGLTQAPKDLDLTPLEKHMEEAIKAKHTPETPEEQQAYQEKMQGIRDGSIHGPERTRALKAARKPYLLKMFSKLSYFEARRAMELANDHERHELHAAMMQKRANALRRSPSTTRNPDQTVY